MQLLSTQRWVCPLRVSTADERSKFSNTLKTQIIPIIEKALKILQFVGTNKAKFSQDWPPVSNNREVPPAYPF